MENLSKIKVYIKEILVSNSINGTLPMDMTQLDVDGLFHLAQACIKADVLLCSSETSVLEQVLAIITDENKSKMIDHIEVVCPSEQFEFAFTVKDFSEQIGL